MEKFIKIKPATKSATTLPNMQGVADDSKPHHLAVRGTLSNFGFNLRRPETILKKPTLKSATTLPNIQGAADLQKPHLSAGNSRNV
jgi:hypothetical protein